MPRINQFQNNYTEKIALYTNPCPLISGHAVVTAKKTSWKPRSLLKTLHSVLLL